MQVLSRRGIASYLRCKNELGFMASSVKALVRDLKGVDTVFISYCFYAIVLQPYNKGSSYPTEACNPTHPKTAMSRYSLQLFQQQSCSPPCCALADKRFTPRTLSTTFLTWSLLPAGRAHPKPSGLCQNKWWRSPWACPWGSSRIMKWGGAPPAPRQQLQAGKTLCRHPGPSPFPHLGEGYLGDFMWELICLHRSGSQ